MKISLIVAMASNRVIGHNNKMPWHLSADLKKFKQITMGSPIIMGRKTFESIGRPLPGRKNIIISRNPEYKAENCQVFHTLDSAIASCQKHKEVFIIGGSTLYQAILDKAQQIYLTQINQEFHGDTRFPEINPQQWMEVERMDINDDSSVDFSYSFIKLIRNSEDDFSYTNVGC